VFLQHIDYRGEEAILLENQQLRVIILPGRGGKTASVSRKESSFELLFQPSENPYPPLYPGMPFSSGDASGFDDVFPSMGDELIQFGGKAYAIPDHGEIWTLPMEATEEEDAIILSCGGRLLPYRYEKRILLAGESVLYAISICNTSSYALPCIWVCHCLMNLEEGVTFSLPWQGQVAENVLDSPTPGGKHTVHPYGGAYDFAHAPRPGTAMKYYLSQPVKKGFCAVEYPLSGIRAELVFNPAELPYLGFWITTGGYRGDQNFAFEPATGYYDTVRCAQKHERLTMLEPGQTLRLHLELRLINL
jgi:galactose mutarotase-like enzyme